MSIRPRKAASRASERRGWQLQRLAQSALLLLSALEALYLLSPRGGLRAVYSVETASSTLIPIQSRVDPTLDFPTAHLLEHPFFQFWSLPALGVPKTLPPFQVRWRGLLRSQETGTHLFLVEAAGEFRFLVDGRALSPREGGEAIRTPLSAGWHSIDLSYRRVDEVPRFRLLWRTPSSDKFAVIPRNALAPDLRAAGRVPPRRIAGSALLAGVLAMLGWCWRRRRDGASFGGYLAARSHGVALSAILLLALCLRMHQYDLIPFHHETADEYQHGWEGWTLLHEGVPSAWTFYPQHYPPAHLFPFVWFGDSYYLARPYFDHPPGFSLIVGAAASLLGAREMLDCTLHRMRLVPIALSLLTVLLVARTGWTLLPDPLAGTLAALLYATLPTVVLGSRLVKAESLLAPLLLAQSFLLHRYLREGRAGDIIRTAAGAFVAIWAKATGISVPAIAVLSLGKARRWSGVTVVLAATGVAVSVYLLYGAYFGWDLFVRALQLQSSKWAGLRSVLDLGAISRVVELQFGGGWYLWLVLAAGWMALGKERELLLPAAVYFVVLVLTVDERAVYGWYRLPLYPYLCLAGGMFLAAWWRERDIARGFLFAATALAATLTYVLPVAAERSRWVVLLIFAIPCGAALWERLRPSPVSHRLQGIGIVLSLAVFFLGNAAIVMWQVPIYLREGVRAKVPRPAEGMQPPVPSAGVSPGGPSPAMVAPSSP